MSPNGYIRQKFKEECKRTRDALGLEFEKLDLGYVSLDFLDEVFKLGTPNRLRESLEEDIKTLRFESAYNNADMNKLESDVRNHAPKLYSILLMINQSERIVKLMKRDPRIDDSIFNTHPASKLSYCSEERLGEEPLLCDIAAAIYKKQWLIPPRFNSGVHENFPCTLFRFPFMGGPPVLKGNGSWGLVYRAKIADRHLSLDPIVQAHEILKYQSVVACKSIKKEDNTTWIKLLREAATLRERKHNHIVPLLASFTAGRANRARDDKQEYLWLLMPYAQAGSMEKWLEEGPEPPKRELATWEDDSFRRAHVRETMLGLVSALAYIHREIKGMIGFHHDIKPSNIILFLNPEPVWKICDFGTANLKDPKEGTGTAKTPENQFGTYTYRPPEYFEEEGVAQHGRAFDVYSLGCVMLELATVYTYAWKPEGLTVFKQQRRDTPKHAYQGNLKPKDDVSFHNCPEVVKSWIAHLKKKLAEDSNTVSDDVQVLDVISEMLLSRYERIFAWEVEMDLYEIFNHNASEQERIKRLKDIVQQSAMPLDQTREQHNPMRRAISHNKGQWYTEILQGRDWNYSARSLSGRSNGMTYGDCGPCTNLDKAASTRRFRSAHFFGRHKIHEKIISGFQKHNTVIGLYGKSGVGKSHSAYYYASGFQKPKDPKDQKHTLWVNCSTRNDMIESFQEIMRVIGAPLPSERDSTCAISSVSDWLRKTEIGPWIMVLDGLEDKGTADELNRILPISDGEFLITTKNKIILTTFLAINNRDAFICMEDLPLLTASYIFDSHINRDLITSADSRDALVERLPLPSLIISMAEHMNHTDYTTQNLQEDERSGANFTIEQQYREFSKRLVSPLLPSPAIRKGTSPRLDLLGEMSCLDATRIEFNLLLEVHTKPDRLQSQLSGLEQCSLISTVENRVYMMQQYVQVAVLQWFQANFGEESVLQLYATALCMLYKRYNDETQEKYRQFTGQHRVPSRQWKLPYKPHFDRFLDFARKNQDKAKARHFASCSLKGMNVMVTAIVTFSKLYLEEHRYDDAICVLEFVDAIYDEHERRYELKRLLMRAYLETPLRDEHNDKWRRIAKLSAELIHEADISSNIERKWNLVLDLVRFYSESHQPEKAMREMRSVWEFELKIEQGEARLYIYLELSLDKAKKRKLAIQRKIEEGRVNFVNAKLQLHQGVDNVAAAKEITKAIRCWEDARTAITSWQLDHDEAWTTEIDELIADACIEIGESSALQKAEEILNRHLHKLKQAVDHAGGGATHADKHTWDLECKIAHACLKRQDKPARVRAIKILSAKLQDYEALYGDKGAWTRNCAYLLRSALRKNEQHSEARVLEQKYRLRETGAVRVAVVKRPWYYVVLARMSWWEVLKVMPYSYLVYVLCRWVRRYVVGWMGSGRGGM